MLEAASQEEKQAWLKALTLHIEHIEAMAGSVRSFPAPLTSFQRQYETLQTMTMPTTMTERIGGDELTTSGGLGGAVGGVKSRRMSGGAVSRRDSDASTLSSASYLTNTTSNTSNTITSHQRRGSTGTLAVVPVAPSGKIPAKVQQHCQASERIVLCGLVKASNRVYLTVFRLLVLFETTASSSSSEEGAGGAEKRKRLVVLDSNSYSIKYLLQWHCHGVSNNEGAPTVTQV